VISRPLALARLLVILVALRPHPARSQPEPEPRAKAAAHVKQGQAFFQRGDFDRALAEYQAAFEQSAEPLLVFNIALCHDRANRPEQALVAFRRYLELAPDGAVSDEAREDVARLAPIVDNLTAERAAAAAAATEEARRRQQATARGRTPPPPAEPPSRVPSYVVIAGATIAAVGVTSHVLAWRARDRVAGAPDPDAYVASRTTFERERAVAIGAYAVGAVTIATGLVLGRVLHRRDVEVSVAVGPGAAALAVGWSR